MGRATTYFKTYHECAIGLKSDDYAGQSGLRPQSHYGVTSFAPSWLYAWDLNPVETQDD